MRRRRTPEHFTERRPRAAASRFRRGSISRLISPVSGEAGSRSTAPTRPTSTRRTSSSDPPTTLAPCPSRVRIPLVQRTPGRRSCLHRGSTPGARAQFLAGTCKSASPRPRLPHRRSGQSRADSACRIHQTEHFHLRRQGFKVGCRHQRREAGFGGSAFVGAADHSPPWRMRRRKSASLVHASAAAISRSIGSPANSVRSCVKP